MTTTCPVEAVFGGGDDQRYPCTYAKGHDGPHSFAHPNLYPPSAADLVPAVTDASDRIPYDVHGRLDDPVNALALALRQWEGRDDARAEPRLRRAAGEALGVIDVLLAELHVMRGRLVSEVRVSDDVALVRSAALLDDGLRGETGPVADVAAFCRVCRRTTVSVSCERCGRLSACVICRRCPDCDGPIQQEDDDA